MQMTLIKNGTPPLAGKGGAENTWCPNSTPSHPPPLPPFHSHAPCGTSEIEAARIAPSTTTQLNRIYQAILATSTHGLIDQQGRQQLGIITQNYTSRRGKLVQMALERDSEKRCVTESDCIAAVWVAVSKREGEGDA